MSDISVSKSCISILHISYNEDFRRGFFEALNVTNSYDAEKKLNSQLKDMYDGIQVNCIENNTVVQSNSDAPAVQTGETSSCDEDPTDVQPDIGKSECSVSPETYPAKCSQLSSTNENVGLKRNITNDNEKQTTKQVKIGDLSPNPKNGTWFEPCDDDFWNEDELMQNTNPDNQVINSQNQPSQSIIKFEEEFDFWNF